jgi:hypothetical protein
MNDLDDTHARRMSRTGRRAARRGSGALLGMIALGVAGFFAWRNRDRIAEKARPMLDDAKSRSREMLDKAAERSHDMMDQAAATGHRLVDDARTKGQAVAAKVRARRTDASDSTTLEMH